MATVQNRYNLIDRGSENVLVYVAHLEENVAATGVSLTRDEIAELDTAA